MGHVTVTNKNGETPKMPDGGWGWVVVAASLLIHLIQDGIAFSFGVLFVNFKDELRASKSSASWVGSLFISVPLITGPVMSILVDKYGCRPMTIVAGLVSATGFLLSYFAQSIEVMYFTFGIIAGCGLGLTYVTAIVAVAFWFDKKRNLAVGLGVAGTGIGTIVYAPFTNFLNEQFGWRWTLVFLAGTLLNICVGGAVMRDPDWLIQQKRKAKKEKKALKAEHSSEKIDIEAIKQLLQTEPSESNGTVAKDVNSTDNVTNFTRIPSLPGMESGLARSNSSFRRSIKEKNISNTGALSSSQKSIQSVKLEGVLMKPRRSVVYHENMLNNNRYRSCPNICEETAKSDDQAGHKSWYMGILELFFLFDELHYLLVSISTIILFAWFMTPYFYLVDHMDASGYPKAKGSLVLSVIGVANTIGMVGLGWLGDQPWTSVSKMYAITIMLCGAACSLLYMCTMQYILLNVFSVCYGIFLASTFVFTPIMMIELLPTDQFTKAFGLQLLCQGVGHLVGPPIAAYLADVTKSWALSFHVSAVWIVIAGMFILAVPYTKNRRLFGKGPTAKEQEEIDST